MGLFELPSDNRPTVRFRGELMGKASTYRNTAKRWSELHAYQTEGGKWIVHHVGMTNVTGEVIRNAVHVYASETAMIKDLGYTKLSSKLFEEIGIDSVTID